MKKIGEVRKKVASILTNRFGDEGQNIIFRPEDTIKRSVAGQKLTKYELKTSPNWYAKSDGAISIWVDCIGMTMTEFISEFDKGADLLKRSREAGAPNSFSQ